MSEISCLVESNGAGLAIGPFSGGVMQARPAAPSTDVDLAMRLESLNAIVRIAIFFHDFGKAFSIFQSKIRSFVQEGAPSEPMPDAVRHEVFSAFACDALFGQASDSEIAARIATLTADEIDAAARIAGDRCYDLYRTCLAYGPDAVTLELGYLQGRDNGIARAICDLVLVHHRLPGANTTYSAYRASHHVHICPDPLSREDFDPYPGAPYWHEDVHLESLRRAAGLLGQTAPDMGVIGFQARTALMLSDQAGSAAKQISRDTPDHLANSITDARGAAFGGDSLSLHVGRVQEKSADVLQALLVQHHAFPALDKESLPCAIVAPDPDTPTDFAWQLEAAEAAARLASGHEGGFFACLMAGTGTGKTRGAPTVLAAAALNDARPERRYFRSFLGLGLRTLASQAAREYVEDLGFLSSDVAVMIGTPPIEFPSQKGHRGDGSESLEPLADWFDTEGGGAGPGEVAPCTGSQPVLDLQDAMTRCVPDILSDVIGSSNCERRKMSRLLQAPVICATVDHLMSLASPLRAKHLLPAVRVMTSDVILDEIDQYGAEDLSAVARLAYHVGLGGRRLVIMSATVPRDVVTTLFDAYRAGWASYAALYGLKTNVNALITSDVASSCFAQAGCLDISDLYAICEKRTSAALKLRPVLRKTCVLPEAPTWIDLVDQIDSQISRFHDDHANEMSGFRVSAGFVKLTRIAHTAAMAAQLPSGLRDGRLRKIICLHSQFPRISRAWIEEKMRQALKRKPGREHDGLSALCAEWGLFKEAEAHGLHEIEIVFVTSPVIETGNDIDFDYAILDPMDLRSIIQAMGRVNRHRRLPVTRCNVALIGKALVVMQQGRFSYPGVETPLDRSTGVKAVDYVKMARKEFGQEIETRGFLELYSGQDIETLDARMLISSEMNTLYRAADLELRRRFFEDKHALSDYLKNPVARLSSRMLFARRFRRSDGRRVELYLAGLCLETALWHLDLFPGTRHSQGRFEKNVIEHRVDYSGLLFKTPMRYAFQEYSGDASNISAYTMRKMSTITIRDPFEGNPDLVDMPFMLHSEGFGLLKGDSDALYQPFGVS